MAKMQLILGLTILLVAMEAALSIPTSQFHTLRSHAHCVFVFIIS